MYVAGLGVERDLDAARSWIEPAALGRDPFGMSAFGALYAFGQGVEQNDSEALRWFRSGAEAGSDYGALMLGFTYMTGRGVKRDWDIAVAWYRVAIGRGNAEAESMLQPLRHAKFDAGDALHKAVAAYEAGDFADAFARLEPLAVAGEPVAQLYLGEAYRQGNGGEKDLVQAQMWLHLASEALTAESDRQRAAAASESIARELSQAELTEARRRAREWWPTSL
jgi:TPR repeat protein